MKNNIRVNISGLIFNIDEDAHQILKDYLERLKNQFGKGENTDEIINDIESRIAEMFIEKTGNQEIAIDKKTVSSVIEIMGEPSEIYDESEETEPNEKAYDKSENKESSTGGNKRRLYRDPDNKIVGGVAGGLSVYFNIDPIWIRLAFILLTFSGGMSILIYIILWGIIPIALSTSQKLEMRGEDVTIDNIRKTIKSEYENLANNFSEMKDKHFRKKKGELTIFEKIAYAILRIVERFFKFISAFIGLIFAFIALVLIIAFIPFFLGANVTMFDLISGFNLASLPDTLSIFTSNIYEIRQITVALAMVLFIPLIALVYQGIKLLFGIKFDYKIISATLFTIWLIGVILLSFSGVKYANQYHREAEISHFIDLSEVKSDKLHVKIDNVTKNIDLPIINSINGQFLFCATDSMYYYNPRIDVRTVQSDEDYSIEIRKKAHGSNYRVANKHAELINYNYLQNDSLVTLDSYSSFIKNKHYNGQNVRIIIRIPEGKSLEIINDKFLNFDLDSCSGKNKSNKYIFIDRHNEKLIINNNSDSLIFYDTNWEIDVN